MKNFVALICMSMYCISTSAGDKSSNPYNKLAIVEGTPYVIASQVAYGKMANHLGTTLHFVNCQTGSNNKVAFGPEAIVNQTEQIKIDSLGINVILVSAATTDVNGKNGIDYSDPRQVFILNTDGSSKIQVTDNKFYVNQQLINRNIGTLVITGYYDVNNNDKNDLEDKNEIVVFNLKTLKVISKI